MANVTVYVMTVWHNLPTKDSAIDATNLNHLEQGIKNVTDFVNTINASSGLYLSQTPFTTALKNKLDGIEAQANKYVLPTAGTGTLGGVKVDGVTITIDNNGVIHAAAAATQLSALTDVNLSQLADGQILKYDSATGKWVNTSEAEVRTQLSLLEDVDIDDQTLADGDALRYNATSEKWENGPSGEVLDYNETLQALGDPAQNVPSIPVVYSTDEQVIGVWIDKRPLYQKSFILESSITFTDNTWVNSEISATNNSIDKIIQAELVAANKSCCSALWGNVDNGIVQLLMSRPNTFLAGSVVTLRYTKTTDPTPNS